jgi:hypothetical protein
MNMNKILFGLLLALTLDAQAAQTELTGVKLSAGTNRACVITSAGAVKCWGAGPLGDGSTVNSTIAIQVTGLESGVVDVGLSGPPGGLDGATSNGGHVCAVMSGGGIKCWGENFYGQLGDGTNTPRAAPVDVVVLPGPATAVAPGNRHTCALLASGAVHCWGDNGLGQLGGNALTSGIVAISGSGNHACALTAGGAVKCWGANFSGQLGDGTTTQRSSPVDVQSLGSGVTAIGAAGILDAPSMGIPSDGGYSCALTSQGGVKCWGAYANGALGDPTSTGDHLTAFDVSGLTSGIAAIATGSKRMHFSGGGCGASCSRYPGYGLTCAVTVGAGVKCWGSGDPSPRDVPGFPSPATALASWGDRTACALVAGGAVRCWTWPDPATGGGIQTVLTGTRPQTVNVGGPYSRMAIGATQSLNGSASSGLPVTYATLTPSICSVSGNIASGLAQGMCIIGASQPGNINWEPAGEQSLGFVVGDPLPQSIAFGAAPTVPVNGVGNLNATASSGLAVSYVSNTPSVCTVSGAFVTGIALGSCTVAASQAGNGFYQPAPQVTQTFPVTANTGTSILRVARGGTGVGTVTSTPAGIDCGTECGGNFANGSNVTLTPTAGTDSFFDRWEGACTGTGACSVSMTATRDVTAHFQSSIPRLANISTRMQVLGGDNVLIAGFIIQGNAPKTVVVRARGPSLAAQGVAGAMQNPALDLFQGPTKISLNFDWQSVGVSFGSGTSVVGCCSSTEVAQLTASGFAPSDPREAAIIRTLNPGAYTAIVTSQSFGPPGVAIVEVFEVDAVTVPLVNISSRGLVQTGDNVMIAGFIIQGQGPQTVVVRARGPSLTAQGVPGVLANPTMQLFSGPTVIAANDDWITSPDAGQIQASGFAPLDNAESAVMMTLQPGAYTTVVSGVGNTTGVAIVEVFRVP